MPYPHANMPAMKKVPASWPVQALVAITCGAAISLALPASTVAQATRRAATVEALNEYPVFFHGEQVILHADVTSEQVLTWIVNDDTRILVLDVPPPPGGIRERLEIVGTFYDIGRMEETDPRVRDLPIQRLAERLLAKPWPRVRELPLVVASSSRPAREPGATTLRGIVLGPEGYINQRVTITGRFRGRNLYGDMPEAPEKSRWDFVLRSADAAVWVVGKEPKGNDFDLDVLARVDTGRWLEVTGTVHVADGMVLVEASTLSLAEPSVDLDPEPIAVELRRLPPPEIIFSAPLQDDTDVATDTTVRVQFSRDMDPDSFEGNVTIRYTTGQLAVPDEPEPPALAFEITYRRRNRVLEIRFAEELDRFRPLTVELLEGIAASDDTPLPPWTLNFFTGS